ARGGPGDLDGCDGGRRAQADFLTKRRAAKTPTGAHRPIDPPFARRCLYGDFDARADGGAVGAYAFQFHFDPVIPVAGIFVKAAAIVVAGVSPTHFLKNVLVTVVVDVAEGNTVAFLQVAESPRRRDILEEEALGVAEHSIGNECTEAGIAGPQIHVQPSVVVQIPE